MRIYQRIHFLVSFRLMSENYERLIINFQTDFIFQRNRSTLISHSQTEKMYPTLSSGLTTKARKYDWYANPEAGSQYPESLGIMDLLPYPV